MSRLTDEDVARGKAAIAAAYPRATPAPAPEQTPAPLTPAQEVRRSIHGPGCTGETPCQLCLDIRAQVDTWPPLTAAQRDRLATLLRGGRR